MVNPEVGATPWMVLPVVGAEDSSVSSSTGEEGAVEGVAERGLEGRPTTTVFFGDALELVLRVDGGSGKVEVEGGRGNAADVRPGVEA